mgnify:CR=1 FL=1
MNQENREITYADAGVEALREEMRRDETIVYLGQGIGPRGGNFRQTRGLWAEFGDHRLRDTGICELGETGVAIGAGVAAKVSGAGAAVAAGSVAGAAVLAGSTGWEVASCCMALPFSELE